VPHYPENGDARGGRGAVLGDRLDEAAGAGDLGPGEVSAMPSGQLFGCDDVVEVVAVCAGFVLQVGGQRVGVDGLRARQRGHDVDRGVGVVQGRAHGVVDRRGQRCLTVRAVALGVLPVRA
jgi:hypothetical protein